jgi:tRNA threonylcarbamoyladenosine biosynthesis protein TsaB
VTREATLIRVGLDANIAARGKMLVLAIDTATPAPALALAGEDFEDEMRLPEGHPVSEALLPYLAELLARAGTSLAGLGRIAVCAGPGSFTGIRVGLATAWGFCRALGIPLETIDALEMMAETARASGVAVASAVLDAERGEAYVAVFDLSGPRAAAVSPIRIVPSGDPGALSGAVVRLPSERPILVSPALAAARAVLASPGPASSTPRARYVRPSAAEEFHGHARA